MARQRTESQREQDLERIAGLYARRYRQADIAKELGLTVNQVRGDLKELRKRWKESGVADFGTAKEEELQRIDAIERDAWEAWRASQEDRTRTESEGTSRNGNFNEQHRVRVTRETTPGDSRFLNIILSCVDRRARLLGLGAPERHELTGTIRTHGTDVEKIIEAASIEELEMLNTLAERIENREDEAESGAPE